ncbi:MAG: isopentenyl transferase family protein [Planctomycetota bacterium]
MSNPMQRILIVGPCGAGKSTLAIQLGQRTGLPVHHMDRLHWKPGWVESSREELREKLTAIVAGNRWIIDGNYSSSFDLRLPRADTIVWLDYPPRLYRWRVLKRHIVGRFRQRTDITEGCVEKFDPEFMRYVWRFHRDRRPELVKVMNALPAEMALHHFRRPRESKAWLNAVAAM